MIKLLKHTCVLFVLLASSAYANLNTVSEPTPVAGPCNIRVFAEPKIPSKPTNRKMARILKQKGYKILLFKDAFFEDYRLVASQHDTFIRFYFQKFVAPNFVELFRVDSPLVTPISDASREAALLDLFKNLVPVCK